MREIPCFPKNAPAAPISLTSPSLVLGLMPATRRNREFVAPVPGCADPRIGSPLLPLTGLEPLRPRRLVESIANRLRTHSILWEGTSVAFEGKQMTHLSNALPRSQGALVGERPAGDAHRGRSPPRTAVRASSSTRASPTECIFSLRTRQIEPGAPSSGARYTG